MADKLYTKLPYQLSEIPHRYGSNVHILCDPLSLTQLTLLCSPETTQPQFNWLVTTLYHRLIHTIINAEFPRKKISVKTRMFKDTPAAVWEGEVIDFDLKVVSVDIARAGMLPSQICYDVFNHFLDPNQVRQDHLIMSRMTDSANRVTGAQIGGTKIGGTMDERILVFPDPMGATGSSICAAIDYYYQEIGGKPLKIIAMNLIITPEFIRRIGQEHPEVVIYAHRLDRGLSPDEIFTTIPGTHWEKEKGLNEHQYIIPGGGGFGELMNNSFV